MTEQEYTVAQYLEDGLVEAAIQHACAETLRSRKKKEAL